MDIVDDLDARLLEEVIALGKRNSRTLGLLPRGAYEDAATRHQILAALDGDGHVTGYLLYRVAKTKNRAAITHLCVSETHRGQGIGVLLVQALKKRTAHLRGIGLYSRQDYESHSFWPKVNFVAMGEKPGRGKDKKTLTFYWFAQPGHIDLFQWRDKQRLREKTVQVVLDANVFFDLWEKPANDKMIAAQSLMSDWLLADVTYCLTREINNEIARNEKTEQRKKSLERAREFPHIPLEGVPKYQMDAIIKPLKLHWPAPKEKKKRSWDSDMRQLGYAIIAGAEFFLTEDAEILEQADWISEQFELEVLRPSDFISLFHENIHPVEYRPVRLAGSRVIKHRVSGKDITNLGDFQRGYKGETKNKFFQHLRRYIAEPSQYTVNLLKDENSGAPIVLIVVGFSQDYMVDIPIFRVNEHRLAYTLATHVLLQMVEEFVFQKGWILQITDEYSSDKIATIAFRNGFELLGERLVKIGLPYALESSEAALKLRELASRVPGISPYTDRIIMQLEESVSQQDVDALVYLEKKLWPLKILDADIPAVIVPIRPRWATDLFDNEQGSRTLFGSDISLVTSRENVYYRSARSRLVDAPGRVLWYITQGDGYQYQKTLRACAHIDMIDIDTPKNLFRKYRRLGVYKFQDLLRVAQGQLERSIMAFQFSGTQLFASPIPWKRLKQILDTESPIQSPRKISPDQFRQICDSAWEN